MSGDTGGSGSSPDSMVPVGSGDPADLLCFGGPSGPGGRGGSGGLGILNSAGPRGPGGPEVRLLDSS